MSAPEVDLEKLAKASQAVATQHEALEAAAVQEHEAEAALLARVVELARPALKALSSRIQRSSLVWWPTSCYTDEKKTWFESRGVRLAGEGPEEDHPSANEGATVGKALFLVEDGHWWQVRYQGSWSRWQGSASEWDAKWEPITLSEAVKHFDVGDVISKLVELLDSHLKGNASKRTKAMQERAERLAAIARLA